MVDYCPQWHWHMVESSHQWHWKCYKVILARVNVKLCNIYKTACQIMMVPYDRTHWDLFLQMLVICKWPWRPQCLKIEGCWTVDNEEFIIPKILIRSSCFCYGATASIGQGVIVFEVDLDPKNRYSTALIRNSECIWFWCLSQVYDVFNSVVDGTVCCLTKHSVWNSADVPNSFCMWHCYSCLILYAHKKHISSRRSFLSLETSWNLDLAWVTRILNVYRLKSLSFFILQRQSSLMNHSSE